MELILFISSVANSCQYFSASPAEKFGCLEKLLPLTTFDLLKAFGLKKKFRCLCSWEKYSIYL
jgi:hypothetical protein